LVAPLLPKLGKGRPRVDDRRVANGIFYVLRTGAPWRDLPERYGPYTTVYNRFNRWAKRGIWLKVFEELALRSPQSLQFIDSSIVRAQLDLSPGIRAIGSWNPPPLDRRGGDDHEEQTVQRRTGHRRAQGA
jgi:transposase